MSTVDAVTFELQRYNKTTNVYRLVDAYTAGSLLVRTYAESKTGLASTNKDEKLGLALKVLEQCYKLRDHSYSLEANNRELSIDAPPPPDLFKRILKSQNFFVSGMASSGIQDPELRKEYEKFVQDNKRAEAMFNQQMTLQGVLDNGKRDFSSLFRSQPEGSDFRKHLTNTINLYVKEIGLRNDLFSQSAQPCK